MRLSANYYRPDQSVGEQQAVLEDMLEDLGDYLPAQVETACAEYRRDPENKFFPRSGQIIEIIRRQLRELRDGARPGGHAKFEFGDSRPLCWEMQPKRWWKPHWKAEDLKRARDPQRYDRYIRWLDRVKAGLVPGKNPDEF